jgi:hypothetical protein
MLCCINVALSSFSYGGNGDNELIFPDTVAVLRSTCHKILRQNAGPDKVISVQEIKQLEAMSRLSSLTGDIANYSLLMLSLKNDIWESRKSEMVLQYSDQTFIVENIFLQLELNSKEKAVTNSYQERKFYSSMLSKLLPINRWPDFNKKHEDYTLVQPPPPLVPKFNRDVMLKLAREFEHAGEWDLAWRAYAEAIYSSFLPVLSTTKSDHSETWLSEEVARYWIRAGECARWAGREDLAESFLTKAAVFADENDHKMIQQVFAKWTSVKQEPADPKRVDENEKSDALTEVVNLYATINAHPRSLQVLDEFATHIHDPEGLRDKIEKEWIAIIKDHSRASSKVILYGEVLYPEGEPLAFRIPWAFADENVKCIMMELQK